MNSLALIVAFTIAVVVAITGAILLVVSRRRSSPPPATPAQPEAVSPERSRDHNDDELATERLVVAAPAGASRYGEVICTAGPLQGQAFTLDEQGIVVGRDAESQLVVEDERISKRHLWIGVRNGRPFAVDEGSSSGTYLNTMDAPRIEKVTLQPGDTLILGDDVVRLLYHR